MKITVFEVRNKFKPCKIEQVGHKQLFIMDNRLLVSYLTIVGVEIAGIWYLTSKKYSRTTSRQLNYFSQYHQTKWCLRVQQDAYGDWIPIMFD